MEQHYATPGGRHSANSQAKFLVVARMRTRARARGLGSLPAVVNKGRRKGLHARLAGALQHRRRPRRYTREARAVRASAANEQSALFPTQPSTMKSGHVYYTPAVEQKCIQDVSMQGAKLSRSKLLNSFGRQFLVTYQWQEYSRSTSRTHGIEVAQRAVKGGCFAAHMLNNRSRAERLVWPRQDE